MTRNQTLGFLYSVRSRVAAFAIIATLLPSVTLGWLSYFRNAEVLRDKAAAEIDSAANFAAREIELWLKDRLSEIRVFASSYVVTENVEQAGSGPRGAAAGQRRVVERRLQDYLRSVGEKFAGYPALQVVSQTGDVIAGTDAAVAPALPAGSVQQLMSDRVVVGDPRWEPVAKGAMLSAAVPVRSAQGQPIGGLVAVMNLQALERILARYPLSTSGEIYLINAAGQRVISGLPGGSVAAEGLLNQQVIAALRDRPGRTLEYRSYNGREVVGEWMPIPGSGWGVIVEQERDAVYAQVYALRNATFWFVVILLAAVGAGAYWFGLTLVRPLDRLVAAANQVASGDLDVRLPVARRDELGNLTHRFNDMTDQLRRNREELAAINEALKRQNVELEAISITDNLTGLFNRRHLMEVLERQFQQYARSGRTFSLLVLDLDHFKRVNDTHGHLAGDTVLAQMALQFKDAIRGVDYAARYGGEEFVLVLVDTGMEAARATAERIRERVLATEVGFEGKVLKATVSIGIAEAGTEPEDHPKALIARADEALYEAKKRGRNRVVCHGSTVRRLRPRNSA